MMQFEVCVCPFGHTQTLSHKNIGKENEQWVSLQSQKGLKKYTLTI